MCLHCILEWVGGIWFTSPERHKRMGERGENGAWEKLNSISKVEVILSLAESLILMDWFRFLFFSLVVSARRNKKLCQVMAVPAVQHYWKRWKNKNCNKFLSESTSNSKEQPEGLTRTSRVSTNGKSLNGNRHLTIWDCRSSYFLFFFFVQTNDSEVSLRVGE